jgi:hypothetical protein
VPLNPQSGGAHAIDEILYLEVELAALTRKELRRLQNLYRCTGLIGLVAHVGDIDRYLRCALRGPCDVVNDLLSWGALRIDRSGDGRGNFRNTADRATDLVDRGNRVLGHVLHFGDQCFVRFRCFGVLRCQHFHFRGDYGETAASFSGMCRLDGGIEGEQIGLPDNRSDEFYDVANAAC